MLRMCFVRLVSASSVVWSLYKSKAKIIISEQGLLIYFLTGISENKLHFIIRFLYRQHTKSIQFQI